MKLMRWLVAGGCMLLCACAVITVNVYFPEKAAKEAYKSLDEMLLKDGEHPTTQETPPAQSAPGARPEEKPQSSLRREVIGLFTVSEAHAADSDAEALAVELSSMPEVLKAYDEMNKRLPRLNQLFDSGAVGLTKQGLVTVRDKAKTVDTDEALVKSENESRKTVVASMAKAIVKLNKQKESKALIDQVMGKAASTFADTKREAAKPGWWMQLENGRWVQK
ncbi:DUF1318 domain-containing protein [Geomonas sp. RF6]|uniref:DUF1318 domain-containing protein n=1 Tax=Geomonas sp. RF6 TaxID=2897342 RepID=UPI002EDB6FAC